MQEDDASLFKQLVAGIRPLEQDKHILPKAKLNKQVVRAKHKQTADEKQAAAHFAFSDLYEAHFDNNGPLRYCRDDIPSYTLKQLRRGDYTPQWVLDCHGLTREQVKQELIGLIYSAYRDHVECVNIMHGIGGGVLKRALPNYLVQHPNVQAFHQAPLEFGGHGALLVLLDTAIIK